LTGYLKAIAPAWLELVPGGDRSDSSRRRLIEPRERGSLER
jgi:hypothetical protein